MTGTIWDRLEIIQTADIAQIKKAYASQLKRMNPEDDPEGFQQLRRAFEQARQWASVQEPQQVPDSRPERTESPVRNRVPEAPQPPHTSPDSRQGESPSLMQEAQARARAILHSLHNLSDEQDSVEAWLNRYFDDEWFVHVDAKHLLTTALLDILCDPEVACSRAVMGHLIDFFGWKPERLVRDAEHWKIMQVYTRYRLEYSRGLLHRECGAPRLQHAARMLAQAPRPWCFRYKALLSSASRGAVSELLDYWDVQCPQFYSELNPAAVNWWRNALSDERFRTPIWDMPGVVLSLLALAVGFHLVNQVWFVNAWYVLPIWVGGWSSLHFARIYLRKLKPYALKWAGRAAGHVQAFSGSAGGGLRLVLLLAADISIMQNCGNVYLEAVTIAIPYLMLAALLGNWKQFKGIALLALPFLFFFTEPIGKVLIYSGFIAHIGGMWLISLGHYLLPEQAMRGRWAEEKLNSALKRWNYFMMAFPFLFMFLMALIFR